MQHNNHTLVMFDKMHEQKIFIEKCKCRDIAIQLTPMLEQQELYKQAAALSEGRVRDCLRIKKLHECIQCKEFVSCGTLNGYGEVSNKYQQQQCKVAEYVDNNRKLILNALNGHI